MPTSNPATNPVLRASGSAPNTAPIRPSDIFPERIRMKRLLTIFLIVAAIAAIAVWFFLRSDSQDNAFTARELATRCLGEYLAQKYPGERALVISNPFTKNDGTDTGIVAMENAGIAGLKKGLGDKVIVEAVAFPELKPEARANPRAVFIDGETTTPLSY